MYTYFQSPAEPPCYSWMDECTFRAKNIESEFRKTRNQWKMCSQLIKIAVKKTSIYVSVSALKRYPPWQQLQLFHAEYSPSDFEHSDISGALKRTNFHAIQSAQAT